jgi:hypothetical protein
MLLGFGLRGVRAVFLERAGQGKFTQLVANHILGHENRLKNFAIMDVKYYGR